MIETRSAVKDQAALDSVARLALETSNAAAAARRLATTTEQKSADRETINKAMDTFNAALKAGATNPLRVGPKPDPLNLLALVTLDTPDARELLALLTQAQAVAERVDASRGRALPPDAELLPGESHGTDLAESISLLTLRLRIETQGPKGRE